jgi:hypothetical protein
VVEGPGHEIYVDEPEQCITGTSPTFSGHPIAPPVSRNFSPIVIGDYEGRSREYVAKVHDGFRPALRTAMFKRFQDLETNFCPFKNSPNAAWSVGRKDSRLRRSKHPAPLSALK